MKKRNHRYFRQVDPLRILQTFRSKLMLDGSDSGKAGYAALDNAIQHHIGHANFSHESRSRWRRQSLQWRMFLNGGKA